jgi:hypothetical protein
MSGDLHNNVLAVRGCAPVAIGTTGTGQVGKIIDRLGYGGVEFIIGYGSITATTAVFTVTVKEGDATSAMTSVADADLLGTEAAAGVGATATRTSAVSKNVFKRIGYSGVKRYVQCSVKSTTTAVPPVSVAALLGKPSRARDRGHRRL